MLSKKSCGNSFVEGHPELWTPETWLNELCVLIDGEKYLPTNTEGNSTFEIPVAALDTALAVTADTVAMSTPHEIDYTLTFDSTTLAAAE